MHLNYSTSPIRVLESSDWRRPISHQQEFFEVRAKRLQAELIQYQQQNLLLRRRLADTDSNILLLEENARLKSEVDILNSEVARLEHVVRTQATLEISLKEKVSQVEILKNQLLAMRIDKGAEIEKLQAQRFLQRSRTSVIVQASSDTSTLLDKQLKKLTDQLRKKNAQIGDLTKRHLAETRKADQLSKDYTTELSNFKSERRNQQQSATREWQRKEADWGEKVKAVEGRLQEMGLQNGDLIKDLDGLKKEKEHLEKTIADQNSEIQGLKFIIEQLRHQHLKEVTQLASSRRKSSKNLGSQRSIGDENLPRSPALAPVKQIGQHNIQFDDSQRLHKAYQLKLHQQSRSFEIKIDNLNSEIERLRKALGVKQDQIKDILSKFAPLVKIQAGELSIEQDRKDRIEAHWKADLMILQVLLDKYKIKMFE